MNILKTKSLLFGSSIISYCKELKEMELDIISDLLFESGTAVGRKVFVLDSCFSKKEFIQNLELAKSEASRTLFLLEISEDIDELPAKPELKDAAGEIIKLLSASIKSAKSKMDPLEN